MSRRECDAGAVRGLGSSLWRGLRGRCPACGEDRLFESWIRVRPACRRCSTEFLENQGDPWAFLVVVDRIFVLLLVVLIYFRWAPRSAVGLIVLFGVLTGAFVATTPHRFGLCLAIAWWVRRRGRSKPVVGP